MADSQTPPQPDHSHDDKVRYIEISQLQPNPFQPRSQMVAEELDELVSSIKTYGILEPLVIAETPAGFQIIAGERRWRAAKLAGLTQVPTLIKKTSPKGMLEMAIVENVQRSDLSPIERAQAFQQLEREFGLTTTEISQKVGKSPAFISNSLKLLQLPDAIKDGLLGGLISEGHARALAGIPDEQDMIQCYKIVLKESASVRRAEELARRYREATQQKSQPAIRIRQLTDAEMGRWERKFQDHFNSRTGLKITRSAKITRVILTFHGPTEQTQSDLEKFIAFAEIK